MKYTLFTAAILSIVLVFSNCGKQEVKNGLYTRADSMITLTLALQYRIGSPAVQRLHEFQEIIEQDLQILEPIESDNNDLVRYRGLEKGLGQCMQACNNYHEEAYMLETIFRELMDQSEFKGAKIRELNEILEEEILNFRDLEKRIDSSLQVSTRQTEIFYALKPKIDILLEQKP